jgi:hypothetical protein
MSFTTIAGSGSGKKQHYSQDRIEEDLENDRDGFTKKQSNDD